MSKKDSEEFYDLQLQTAVGAEVVAFLEEHRDEIIARALEKIKRVRKETAETNDEAKL